MTRPGHQAALEALDTPAPPPRLGGDRFGAPPAEAICGNCHFGKMKADAIQLVECRGAPPVPIIVGMTPQGPAFGAFYPNIERKTPACGLWARKLTVILAPR